MREAGSSPADLGVDGFDGPGADLKRRGALAEDLFVLRAVRPACERSSVCAPANLESVDALFDLRAQIDAMLEIPGEWLEINCAALHAIPSPVFGWLVALQRELAAKGQVLICTEVSARLVLAFRAVDPELANDLLRGHAEVSDERASRSSLLTDKVR